MKAPLSPYAKRVLSDPEARARLMNLLMSKKGAVRVVQKNTDWTEKEKGQSIKTRSTNSFVAS